MILDSTASLPNSKVRRFARIVIRFAMLVLLSIVAFGSAPLLLTLGSYGYYQISDEILPGITVGGVPVGGLQSSEAARALHQVWNEELKIQAIDISTPSRTWEVSPVEFGLGIAAAESAVNVHALGRSGNIIEQIQTMLHVLEYGAEMDPLVELDLVLAKQGFERWAGLVSYPPREADLLLDGGSLAQVESMPGYTLDVAASLNMLAEEPESILLDLQFMPLVMFEVPAKRQDVSNQAAAVQALLDSGPTVQLYDPVTDERLTWSPDSALIASWIEIEPEGSQLSISLLDEGIEAYVIDIVHTLGEERWVDAEILEEALRSGLRGEEAETLVIEYTPGSYVVDPADNLISIGFKVGMPYWKLNEFNPNLAISGLVPGETLVVPPKDDLLTLPVIPEKRIVISMTEQRMWTYQEGELLQTYIVSTGIPNSPTLPGLFQVTTHEENAYAEIWDLYMPHFMGIYEAVPGFTNGIHGLPMLSGGRRLWANVLGQPASYGCIILDLQAAEDLFYWADEGVVVEIQS